MFSWYVKESRYKTVCHCPRDFADNVFNIRNGQSVPVKNGDEVKIQADAHVSNQGNFDITDFSSEYVEFVNTFGVDETFINLQNSVNIFEHLIGFMSIRGDGEFTLKINDGESFKVGILGNGESLFFGSVHAYKIEAINDSVDKVSLLVQSAAVADC